MMASPRAALSQPKNYQGPPLDEVVQGRRKHLSAGQYWFYKEPLMLVQASQQYCWDEKGNKYVDAYSNVCHIGHTHPHVVQACSKAMATIVSNTRYLHPTIVAYAEKLKSKLPSKLNVCYFVNSGSEANDLAMRLARIYTGRKPIVCLEHAYHGTTASCTGISSALSTGSTSEPKDYEYCKRDIYVAPVPDPYRGKYRGSDPRAGEKYARDLERVCDGMQEDPAAFIHESSQGVGGQIVYPPDYLQLAYKAVRARGGVCIADEVQTGFGRSGTHFWAFEVQGVTPDIVVMGKPIGNGFPLGAVVTTREIAQSFDDCQYFNTAGGNPVSCAAGLAVLEVIEREGLQENARITSIEFMRGLRELKRNHPCVGDCRGIGMYVGLELVRDRATQEPADKETAWVMERMRHYGVLVGKGGPLGNVLRLKPPICFNADDARIVCEAFDKVFTELQRGGAHISRMPAQKAITGQRSSGDAVPCTYVYAGADASATTGDETVREYGPGSARQRPSAINTKRGRDNLLENDYETEYDGNGYGEYGANSARRRIGNGGPVSSVLSRVPNGLGSVVSRTLNQQRYDD